MSAKCIQYLALQHTNLGSIISVDEGDSSHFKIWPLNVEYKSIFFLLQRYQRRKFSSTVFLSEWVFRVSGESLAVEMTDEMWLMCAGSIPWDIRHSKLAQIKYCWEDIAILSHGFLGGSYAIFDVAIFSSFCVTFWRFVIKFVSSF